MLKNSLNNRKKNYASFDEVKLGLTEDYNFDINNLEKLKIAHSTCAVELI